jgi:hypothetical protein
VVEKYAKRAAQVQVKKFHLQMRIHLRIFYVQVYAVALA